MKIDNILVHFIGFPATILHGDPAVFDRWLWLRRHLTKGPVRTLDAGCGSGAFTLYAAKQGSNAVGLSFNARNNEMAKERARILRVENAQFHQVDLRELDAHEKKLGTFDQVLCLETIEHILDDEKLIKDIGALLNPGGRLLLTTPYKHHRSFKDESISTVEDGGHMRKGYTHEELERLCNKHGIQIVRKDYISGAITRLLLRITRSFSKLHPKLGWALTMPLRIIQVIDKPVTRALRYPYFCVGIVGVKDL
jgi:SAM-dependent methyltransferase